MKTEKEPSQETETVFVPKIPNRYLKSWEVENDWVVRVNHNISEFNRWMSYVPVEYKWHFKSLEAFQRQVDRLREADSSTLEFNNAYWTDTLHNCQAYTVMSVWKMVELSRSTAHAVIRGDFVVAAILGRAALENAVQYCDAARTISATLEKITTKDLKQSVLVSEDLERLILKTVFASRLPETEDYYNATNIMTVIQRISKVAEQGEVLKKYSYLCEIAHPNWLGRSVYIVDSVSEDDTEIRRISMRAGPGGLEILGNTLWALSWAIAAQMSAGNLLQGSLVELHKKIEKAALR